MSTATKLGIWMDHSNAHLIEFKIEESPLSTNTSTIKNEDVDDSLSKGENLMNNKKQQHQAAFYKKLEAAILHYEEVILFGPTDAKTELYNILQADHRFEKIKIEVQSADKMTENQKLAFVLNHYKKD